MKKNYYLLLFVLLSFWSKSFAQSPGCPNVAIADIAQICNPGDCMTLSAQFLRTGETTSYAVSAIDYAPPFPFVGGNYVSVEGDDDWSDIINLGFNFCFFGNSYDKALITDNGALTFSIAGFGGQYQPSGGAGFSFSQPIPFLNTSIGPPYRSSIMGVLQDTDARASSSGPNKSINYQILGTFPCRTLVFNIYDIGQFNCNTNVGTQTSQMVIYEGTNVIEVYVQKRTPCLAHNGGNGVIGIQNENGTLGYAPPGRNTGTWSAFDEAWRFTPSGEKNYNLQWYINEAPVLSDTDGEGNVLETLTICPTETLRVKAVVTYNQCNAVPIVVQDEKVIVYNTPPTFGTPRNLTECADALGNATFDLTRVQVDLTTDPIFRFSYFENEQDALDNTSSIPTSYVLNIANSPKTIFVRVSNILTGCRYIKRFVIETINCGLILNHLPDMSICEGQTNSFNLNQYDSLAYFGDLGYQVSYHHTEQDAIDNENTIPAAESSNYVATSGETIWVRVEKNDNPAIYGITSFKLFVFDRPEVYDLSPIYACEIPGTGLGDFNLRNSELEASGLLPNLEISFYKFLADAELGNVNNSLPLDYRGYEGTIYVRAYNPVTGCYSIMNLTANIVDAPIATEIAPLTYCSESNNGYGLFNLEATKVLISENPIPDNVVVSYHETESDALNNVNLIGELRNYQNIVANRQTVYVRVGYINSSCASIVPLVLIVNPTPVVKTPTPLYECDFDNNGYAFFNLTSKIDETLSGLNPLEYSVSFYVNEVNANAGVNQISNPANYSNLTSNFVYIRVENNTTGCFKVVVLQLVVEATPVVANPLPTYQVCDSNFDGFEVFNLGSKVPSILGNQTGVGVTFHYTQSDADAGINPLPSLYQNVVQNVQTIFVRLTQVNTGCYAVSTMDLRVSPVPVLTIPAEPFQVCNTSQTGYGAIDLTSFNSQLLNGGPEYDLTYFETRDNAENNVFPIASPTQYNNIHSATPSVWVRAVNPATGCFSVYKVNFKFVIAPRLPLTLPEIVVCDVQGDVYDFVTPIDLTVQTPLMIGAQTVPGNYVVHYFTSEALAFAGTDWIANPEAYINDVNPQTFWVRIENQDHPTICFSIMSFNVKVNVPLRLGVANPLVVCNDSLPNDERVVFDLTVRENQITQGEVFGTTISYYLTEAEAKAEINAIVNPQAYENQSNPQTIWISVTNMYGCKALTTMTLRVLPLPEPNLNPLPIQECEDELGSGFARFNLYDSRSDISNGSLDLNYTFFTTEFDAIANVNQIGTPEDYYTETSVVYVRVTNTPEILTEQCFVVVPLQLIVNKLPQIGPMSPFLICMENAPDHYTFNLKDKDVEALAGQNPSDFSVRYYLDEESAKEGLLPISYRYTNVEPDAQVIYVRVENNLTKCYSIAPLLLKVEEKVFAYVPTASLVFCDTDGVNDGLGLANITSLSQSIISDQPLTGELVVRYFTSWANYNAGIVTDPRSYPITNNPQLVIAEVYNRTASELCSATIEFYISMSKTPTFDFIPDGYICPDYRTDNVKGYLIDTELPTTGYSFTWMRNGVVLNEVGPSYIAETAGTYIITVVSEGTGCSYSQTVNVLSGPAITIDQVNITDSFAETNAIEVIASAQTLANLEYALDNGAYQDSNIFLDVTPGTHIVWVKVKGLDACATSKEINVLNYPKFFTPNGDGYNDTWNIFALKDQPEAKIYIFDRQGKLLKQLSPASEGWDGSFNGQPLPSTDYWFKAEFIEPNTGLRKEATGHFTLKR